MPEDFALTCLWIDDRCSSKSIGMAAHAVYGVIPICKYHADMGNVPLITRESA